MSSIGYTLRCMQTSSNSTLTGSFEWSVISARFCCAACIALAGLFACEQDPDPASTQRDAGTPPPGGGGGGTSSTPNGGGGGSTTTPGGSGGSAAGTSAGGAPWSSGDAAWAPLSWAPEGCDGIEYARDPSKAAPTLKWIPCENGNAGCTRLVTDWERSVPQRARFTPNIFHPESSGLEPFLWSARVQTTEDLEVVYRDNEPILVIRSSDLDCKPAYTQPTSKGVCIVFPQLEGIHVALIDWNDPSKEPPLLKSSAMFSRGCFAEDRLASPGGSPRLYSLSMSTGVETPVLWDGGLFGTAQRYEPFSLIIFGSRATGKDEAWYHTEAGGLQRLPVDGNVWSLTFDGHDIVWMEVEGDPYALPDQMPGVLWASPAPGFGDWHPRRVTEVAPTYFGLGAQRSGQGVFALVEHKTGTFDRRAHAYRLSDGKHWELPNLPDLVDPEDADKITVPAEILRVTDTEIWWTGMSESVKQATTVVRQRLDTL